MTPKHRMIRRTLLQSATATAGLAVLGGRVIAQPTNPDVVIIGAGAAGLAAAKRLIAEGLEVVVIEAADRIGGRAWTESTSLGVPFDRGASWMQGHEGMPLVTLAQDLGLGMVDHSRARDRLFLDGRAATTIEHRQRDATWAAFFSALARGRSDVPAQSVAPMDAPFANVIATWTGPMDFGVDFDQVSRRDWYSFADYSVNMLLREGFGALVAAYGRDVPVTLGTAATHIDWSGQGVRVETSAGTIAARACIVTVSTGVLASGAIRFTPDLPDTKQQALDDLPMGQLLKIGLMFDGARLGVSPNDFLSHDIAAPLPAPACYFLAFPTGHDYLVGLVGGSFGSELEAAGEAAAIAFALETLEGMLGSDIRRHFRRGTMAGWEGNPLSRGAYSAARPGGFSGRRALEEPLGDRVFFAGEAMATPYATLVTGAQMHGDRIAAQLAAQLNTESCAGCAARGQDKLRRVNPPD